MNKLLFGVAVLALSVGACPQSSKADQEKAALAKLQQAYTKAGAAYVKKPKSSEAKKAYVAATVKLGTATMTSPSLGPKEKYPRALRLYREALKIDPKNKEALDNKKMIEDIYKSMGREIPKS